MNYVVRMLAMTDCGYGPVHGFTVVVDLHIETKTKHIIFLQYSLSTRTISQYGKQVWRANATQEVNNSF